MKTAVQALLLVATFLTTPSAAAPLTDQHSGAGTPPLYKVTVGAPAEDAAATPTIDLAQAFAPPDQPGGFDGPAFPPRPFARFLAARMAQLPPRQACMDRIDRHAALAGYIHSKLQLRPEQKEAWRKVEEAAEPGVQALRAVCAQLPDRADARPTLPDAIDLAEKAMTARLALVHAIREPVRQLYDQLSPEQRAVLVLPMHPGRF